MIRAVLFDVDFTLIYPGPMFRGEGYHAFCAHYGMDVDPVADDWNELLAPEIARQRSWYARVEGGYQQEPFRFTSEVHTCSPSH